MSTTEPEGLTLAEIDALAGIADHDMRVVGGHAKIAVKASDVVELCRISAAARRDAERTGPGEPTVNIRRMKSGDLWMAHAVAGDVTVSMTHGKTPDEALRKLQEFAALFPNLNRERPVPSPQTALAQAIAPREATTAGAGVSVEAGAGWQAGAEAMREAAVAACRDLERRMDEAAERRDREGKPTTIALSEAIAALPLPAPGAEVALPWQPIETAPKDGRLLLLATTSAVITGFWLDNSKTQSPWEGWSTSGKPFRGPPTHWMPLPAPPAAEDPAHDPR